VAEEAGEEIQNDMGGDDEDEVYQLEDSDDDVEEADSDIEI
jgi:hypothetical protein